MVFLGLVGAPAAPISYPAYQALKAGGTALGAVLGAAESAAVAGIAATTAAAVGAGVGGFLLGQAILKSLDLPPLMPDMGEYYEAGVFGGTLRVKFKYIQDGVVVFDNAISQIIFTPAKGIFYDGRPNTAGFFMLDRNNDRQFIISTTNPVPNSQFIVLDLLTVAGEPITPTKRLPSYAPTKPGSPQIAPPVPITLPGIPAFPISPRVVPNPANDPDLDDSKQPPGLIVQIPETGQQIEYGLDGVRISNYTNPEQKDKKAPAPILPPGGKVATPPCCNEPEPEPPDNRIDEVICRVKTLQDEILDDGFDFRVGQTTTAVSGFYEVFDEEFQLVKIQVVTIPSNLRIQSSTSPASNVWYVGWFSWVQNGFPGIRLPLHFQNSNFLAPPGVTGFMYQLNAGCTGFGQYRIQTKRPFIDLC